MHNLNRRHLLTGTAALTAASLLLGWAHPANASETSPKALQGPEFDLHVSKFPIRLGGKQTMATGVNGTVPGPLLRFQEGEEVTLNVHNMLDIDSSIHWHGLLVPFQMDGVPGVTFPGIRAGERFQYKFSVPQNGTYWYHSHSGLQEQLGHYGPIIIDPAGPDPVQYDREYVLMLGDWTFTDPHRIFAKLKKNAESLNFNQATLADPRGLGGMWGQMRMSPNDLADVGGETYSYVINGHTTADNFSMLFKPGERVRLRIINAAAMTLFNVRIPGLPMTIVQADGLHVQPLEVDEFQMGVAETYDVIVEPKGDEPFAFVAESIDRSGQAIATLTPKSGLRAAPPEIRSVPILGMEDMGMDHSDMIVMEDMGHGMSESMYSMSHEKMDHSKMSHNVEWHNKTRMAHAPDPHGPSVQLAKTEAQITRGVGVANVAVTPMSRLDEPGLGLEKVDHRTLTYSQLRSLVSNPDTRAPKREVVVHLTANMERYMWSFDGVKFSEVTEAIKFYEGERVRLTLVNNTMMPHPIHLHGMFFDLVIPGNEQTNFAPRKHTVIVKPGEKVSVDVSANHVGDWAFHCHLLYHMHAGMMQVVSVLPKGSATPPMIGATMEHHEDIDHSKMKYTNMKNGEMNP